MATETDPKHFMHTTGATDPVWVHKVPYSEYPTFPELKEDLETDVCIIGAGIAGIQTAYELINRGREVVMIEARAVLSGNTSRTSGHLTNDLDDGFVEIAKKHGEDGAKIAAESQAWGRDRIGEISKKLGIECEYRKVPAYELSQYKKDDPRHAEEVEKIKQEVEMQKKIGMETHYEDGLTVPGWTGALDQRDGALVANQATFHPTQYCVGVLKWLKKQPKFRCFTHTRVVDIKEKGIEVLGLGHKTVEIQTESGKTIKAEYAVEATCVPLQKLSIIGEMSYTRSYCIAIRVPKGSVQDALIYDQAEAYKYVRLTEADGKDDYMVVGGCDHEVGHEETAGRFEELEQWTRERFPQATTVDYKWSGQVYDPVDYMQFIGRNPGMNKVFIVTGDSGDGLTNAALAGGLLADEMEGKANPWASLYSPNRMASIIKSLPSMISHDVEINTHYKRFLQSDIQDIEDLAPGCGGVLNKDPTNPIAVYKDEHGKVQKMSALCPHMKGVVCWNQTEKSWDCPVHGSRFSKDGICVDGPAKTNLSPADDAGKAAHKAAAR
ncbi:DAO-domain-containing protein [Coniochaeta ligniaria NRRL 30616]|uniref:DAO-domain-containing protein n=1 Tax=Coniochaeta ligniaria NRRL 30616 TaxID=1408157 RepID=A0A1J7IZP6_9PEZI|nr:DAO-domain-containing protein [Coniochaeta ligniaria NRRL 30616]